MMDSTSKSVLKFRGTLVDRRYAQVLRSASPTLKSVGFPVRLTLESTEDAPDVNYVEQLIVLLESTPLDDFRYFTNISYIGADKL